MTAAAPGLTLADLEGILARTDPAVVLVPTRILRRAIKQDRALGGLSLRVPHYKCYVIGRDALLTIADRDELGVSPTRELPETLILLRQPDSSRLRSRSASTVLLIAWRFLFHARVHVALAARRLDRAAVLARIRRLGVTVFSEVCSVLRQENFLLPAHATPASADGEGCARESDEQTAYEEFAALYLELHFFAPHLLPRYFPAIADFEAVDRLLAEDVNAEELFTHSRPEGAPLPEPSSRDHERLPAHRTESAILVPASHVPPARAELAASRGNDVRAARLLFRAGRQTEAVDAVHRLTARLQNALHFPEAETAQWRSGLDSLLEPASGRLWPVEARLLYDLQRACVSQEKEVYALDFVEWAVTWGQRPIKRLLPHQPFVLTVKHLRRALRRLTVVRMPDDARHLLHELLVHAVHQAEKRLRERFRPLIHGAVDDVELRPVNYPERIARDTIVEELLDRVLERGFLTMGDLRDALARNRLKLPDVAHPGEIVTGDKLLKANRRLTVALDGVYRRGEIYLRWLQRLSSIFFGTMTGRFLVLFLILPLGGACVAVKGPQLVDEEVQHISHRLSRLWGGEPSAAPAHSGRQRSGLTFDESDILPITLAALVFLGLLHSAVFRRVLWLGLAALWRGLVLLFLDLPALFFNLPLMRRILQSRAYLALWLYVLKPLAWAVPPALIFYWSGADTEMVLAIGGAVFVTALILLNSRAGLRIEEAVTDALVRGWLLLRDDLLPGLFRRIMGFFKWLLEGFDRIIYTVDEWLRYRTGDSRVSLILKPVLGLVWFVLTYVTRFVITLFVEPTINPIKHFPVVTVAAKLLVPLIPMLNAALMAAFEPTVGRAAGHVLSVTVILLLPGSAGFLVWELKENWKLYRANQPDELQSVTVGSHGETILRLIRPGFHSGTLPKLYAKLRRYERRRHDSRARKRRDELHHVEEAVRHFAERQLVAVLAGSHGWGRTLFIGAVHGATNQIRIEIVCTGAAARAIPAYGPHGLDGTETSIMRRLVPEILEIAFEQQSGWLVAGVSRRGWSENLGREERLVLADALAGFYKLAGVDLVSEQVAAILPEAAIWSMRDNELIVWRDNGNQEYSLSDAAALPWERVRFDRLLVKWADWVTVWQRDQDGKGHEPPLLPDVRLLP